MTKPPTAKKPLSIFKWSKNIAIKHRKPFLTLKVEGKDIAQTPDQAQEAFPYSKVVGKNAQLTPEPPTGTKPLSILKWSQKVRAAYIFPKLIKTEFLLPKKPKIYMA